MGLESEVQSPNSPTFLEYSKQELKSHTFESLILEALPAGFEAKDIVVRIVHLPENEKVKQKRVTDILKSGTDRTSSWHPSNFGELTTIGHQYKDYAQDGNTTVSNIFLCLRGESFKSISDKNGIVSSITGLKSGESNSILIYDAKTENGVEEINTICYKFKKPADKPKALLAVISLKS